MLDTSSIQEYRDKINYFLPVLNNRLRNYQDKNLWNVICSAMDWIKTSVHWLAKRRMPEVNHDPYDDSMNLSFYILAVDMLYEEVNQLHRVLYCDIGGKKDVSLLKGSRDIFSDIGCCSDDIEFFKCIRAIYGTHSVNLDLKNYFYQRKEYKYHEGERWFASWSYSIGGMPTDVFIYSNQPHDKPYHFSIKIDEIHRFAEALNDCISEFINKAAEIEESL